MLIRATKRWVERGDMDLEIAFLDKGVGPNAGH
jgi:hypothetical protein